MQQRATTKRATLYVKQTTPTPHENALQQTLYDDAANASTATHTTYQEPIDEDSPVIIPAKSAPAKKTLAPESMSTTNGTAPQRGRIPSAPMGPSPSEVALLNSQSVHDSTTGQAKPRKEKTVAENPNQLNGSTAPQTTTTNNQVHQQPVVTINLRSKLIQNAGNKAHVTAFIEVLCDMGCFTLDDVHTIPGFTINHWRNNSNPVYTDLAFTVLLIQKER
jgi:hypothetical protein